MLLLLIKETYNLLYLHLLKLSHERLTVMLITKKCAYHVKPHTRLAPPHLLIYRKYAFLDFKMAFNTVYSNYNDMFLRKL